MIISKNLRIPEKSLELLCSNHKVKSLSLFGSVLRDDFTEDSDMDILVEYLEGQRISYFDLVRLQRELSGLFGNRKVDVRTPMELSRYFRDDVRKNAKVIYAAG